MYRPRDENVFRKLRDIWFPCNSNCKTTKRKVCLGCGAEVQEQRGHAIGLKNDSFAKFSFWQR